jgi:hypothetical protein
MNFEHLLQFISVNYYRIANKKFIRQFLANEHKILKLKKEKLKLGKITFSFNYYYYGTVCIYEYVEMVHSRQDNTDENEKKIEFLLQKYS